MKVKGDWCSISWSKKFLEGEFFLEGGNSQKAAGSCLTSDSPPGQTRLKEGESLFQGCEGLTGTFSFTITFWSFARFDPQNIQNMLDAISDLNCALSQFKIVFTETNWIVAINYIKNTWPDLIWLICAVLHLSDHSTSVVLHCNQCLGSLICAFIYKCIQSGIMSNIQAFW